MYNDEYELYDLKVEVIASDDGKSMICPHSGGDYFTLINDDDIGFPPGQTPALSAGRTVTPFAGEAKGTQQE